MYELLGIDLNAKLPHPRAWMSAWRPRPPRA